MKNKTYIIQAKGPNKKRFWISKTQNGTPPRTTNLEDARVYSQENYANLACKIFRKEFGGDWKFKTKVYSPNLKLK